MHVFIVKKGKKSIPHIGPRNRDFVYRFRAQYNGGASNSEKNKIGTEIVRDQSKTGLCFEESINFTNDRNRKFVLRKIFFRYHLFPDLSNSATSKSGYYFYRTVKIRKRQKRKWSKHTSFWMI